MVMLDMPCVVAQRAWPWIKWILGRTMSISAIVRVTADGCARTARSPAFQFYPGDWRRLTEKENCEMIALSHGWCREDAWTELTESVSRLEGSSLQSLPSRLRLEYRSPDGPKGHRGFFLLQGFGTELRPIQSSQLAGSPQ